MKRIILALASTLLFLGCPHPYENRCHPDAYFLEPQRIETPECKVNPNGVNGPDHPSTDTIPKR